MRDLTGAQTRQLIDCEQVYAAWRTADRDVAARFAGSMAWKSVNGKRYLYRKQGATWKSIGADSETTRTAFDRFHAGRDALKQRRASLDAELQVMAPVNRAMRLGRVPWTAARILRRLDRAGVLGHGLRVAGTHALYGYERMGGMHFGADVVATVDIDLLYDARGRLDLVAVDEAGTGLIGMLRATDRSFTPIAAGGFRAANAKGFMVDLITPMVRYPATRPLPIGLGGSEDLSAAEIEGLV